MIAKELNDAGLEVGKTLPQVDIPWNKELVKECIWKPIQQVQLKKNKTSHLSKKELNEVQEVVNRWLSNLGIIVYFPSIENYDSK